MLMELLPCQGCSGASHSPGEGGTECGEQCGLQVWGTVWGSGCEAQVWGSRCGAPGVGLRWKHSSTQPLTASH